MKKLFAILTSIVLLCGIIPLGTIPVSAATSGTTGDCTWTLNGTKLTISGNGKMENYDWTGTPWGKSITSVTIKDGVTSIGEDAFYDCDALTKVTIPDSVTYIYDHAFEDCTALTSITLGNGVSFIGYSAFWGCSSLPSITLGKNVSTLYWNSFSDCDSLTAINVVEDNETYSSVDGVLFDKNKTTLIYVPAQKSGTFVLPDSVTTFNSTAFDEATRLTAIIAGEDNASYTSIDGVLFNKDKTKLVRFPIGKSGDYIVPDGVTTIGYDACQDCVNLTSIILPSSVTSIDDWALSGCTSLSNITIPDSVTYIGNSAFSDTAYYNKSSNWDGGVLYVGNHLVETDWSLSGTCVIKEGTKTIAKDAFSNRSSLTAVLIPDSVVTIAHYAFYYCTALETVVMGNGVKSIGNHAFDNTDITSIHLAEGLTFIGHRAFAGADFTSIRIPDSVTHMDTNAFENTNLTSAVIGDGLTSIPAGTFYNCDNLTNLTIGSGITSIESNAFYGCDIENVYITDLANWCTLECTHDYGCPHYFSYNLYLNGELLTDLVIPDSITSIKKQAFDHCKSLTSVTIPDSVTSIGAWAFASCNSLSSVTIPNSVTFIGSGAFHSCDSLISITIPHGVTSIDSTVAYCESLTSITIPKSVTSINNFAFAGCLSLTDVYYTGSEEDRADMTIGSYDNYPLLNATWHYNYIPPCNHVYAGTITTPNNCGNTGVITYTCTACGDTYTEILPATGKHVYDSVCDTTCNICGEIRQVNPHSYAGTITTPAGCGNDGVMTYVCSACGDTYTEVLPASAKHVYDNSFDADCNLCGHIREVPDMPAGSIVVSTMEGTAGEQVNVAITLPNNPGIVSAKVKVFFDASVLKFVGYTEGAFSLGGYSTSDPDVANKKGYFIVNWCDVPHGNSTADLLATLTFEILEDAEEGFTAITLSFSCEDDMFNAAEKTIYFEAVNGGVQIAAKPGPLPGNVNGDNEVNNKDLGLLQRYLNEWEVSIDTVAADTDGNGRINNQDLGLLLRYLNGWDVELG